jgi:hypothetical protein
MKVTNALVTWDDLSTMGLTAKGTPPTGLGIANKAELIAAYYVNEAASPFSTYTSDRCPPYQTIQNTTTTTTTTATPTGFMVTLAGAALSEFGSCSSGPVDFYITSSSVASAYNSSGDVSLLIGFILYEDNILTVPTSYTYASDSGGIIWQIISSSIVTTTGNNCG